MRKILASLLVAAMVLGLVGTAFAGYSDTASHADGKFIDKATAFSWMKGYPDGSFKPAGNITRAEFAAVVVRALGLEAAASSTAGLATKFKDVPASHWAAGYINVATNKGVIKGYPDGTFKPEANVTNAEAITMVVRALSREADAVGEWPVGHISVAASNSIIGSGFSSNALATRADVARYVSKAADVKWKELTTNGWVESTATPPATFLKANNLEKVSGVVNNIDTNNKTITMDVSGTANTYTLDNAYLIGGGISLIDLKGYTVDAFRNKDTSKVVFVEPSTTTTAKKGFIRAVGSDYFYLTDDSTKYTVGYKSVTVTGGAVEQRLDVTVVRNGSTVVTSGSQTALVWDHTNRSLIDLKVDDDVTFFIGSNGNVTHITARGYDYTRAVVTDTYTAGTPNSITVKWIDTDVASGASYIWKTTVLNLATDCKVELNGKDAKFTDIKKDMVVSIAADSNNNLLATIINAADKTITGKVTAKRTTVSEDGTRVYASIDGVEYRFESIASMKDSEQYTRAVSSAPNNGFYDEIKVGQTISLTLSQRGRGRVIDFVSGIANMGRVKRFITGTSGTYDAWVMDMKGTETTYEIARQSDTSLHGYFTRATNATVPGPGLGIAVADYVSLTFDADGRINGVSKLVTISPTTTLTVGDVYSADKLVTLNSMAYMVTNDTLIYVNDAPGTLASVSKGAKAAVAFSTTAGDIKLRALVVDTFAKMDTSSMVADRNQIKGWTGAAENNATVMVYTTYSGGVFSGIVPQGTSGGTTGVSSGGASASYPGGFTYAFTTPFTAATTVYVVVIDRFGNTTSSPIQIP